ncbi:NAD-dependent epimerase/dehydratase family protein [Solibacillus isronensis]|uniref:NAD-dependent epimerase/dehydratase family protein n=1 Tax=Solibacillus isronensis TaxID=412383 RepID=UPI0009A62B13|nr:NAD-dependent epimerase/dehydratase family protein [Solibacillus isronensis]
MMVLITGGYGFIGSHVAEQFYKEGYEVYILDDLSTGKVGNISFKHKSAILSIDDVKCKEIFKSYNFDIVVHLAAQVNVTKSIINPVQDAQSNIVGLLNILQLSIENKVKKFIFASSAAVYGDNPNIPLSENELPDPISPYGMSKWMGEQYCTAWGKQHDIEIICFRFSNVYGPRQTNEGEGGVVSIFTSNILNNIPLEIHGDGNQTRDFIYVKDVAFAIYRASQSFISGIYNLSTNSKTSINQLIGILKDINPHVEVTKTAPRDGDIYHSSLNNAKVTEMLDWTPFYSIEDGLRKTYEWATNAFHQQIEHQIKEKRKNVFKFPEHLNVIRPYTENIILFTILSMILLQFNLSIIPVFFFGVFYIMTIGAIYGNTQAFTGVVLTFLLLVYTYSSLGRDLVSLLYDTTFLFQIVTILFIGLVIGYSTQRKNIKIQEQKEQLEDLEKRYHYLQEIYTEVRNVKNELQFRVKNNEHSFGKIYSIIKELDYLEPEKIFTNSVKVTEKIMHCNGVAVYQLNTSQTFLRLVAHSDFTNNNTVPASLKVEDTAYIQQMMNTGKPFINRSLSLNTPLMAAPIYYNGQMCAVIAINNLPFESFSRYHENLFTIVKELIQRSLSRAYDFIELSEDQRYIKNTTVLYMEKFKEIVQAKEDARTKYNIPYKVLTLTVPLEQLIETSTNFRKILRETDYLGYENNLLYILLPYTQNRDLPMILKRFETAGYANDFDEKVF